MRKEFVEYFRPNDSEFKDIWTRGIIALDTNVLLGLYRFTQKTRDALFDILEHPKIVSRLWVPYQVCVEFHRNRPKVIIDQTHVANVFRESIEKSFHELLKNLKQIPRYHPFIDRERWEKRFRKAESTFRRDIVSAGAGSIGLLSDDPIRDRLVRLLEGKIGAPPPEALAQRRKVEGDRRLKERVPPGFADSKKDPERQLGDYLIWTELIEESERRCLPLILVIDDAKEDWWQRVDGRTLGPNPILRREFVSKTGQAIYLYSSEQFVTKANEFAGAHTAPAAIEELVLNTPKVIRQPFRDFHEPPDDIDEDEHEDEDEDEDEDIDEAADAHSMEEMIRWFYSQYEDPANGVPHDSGEGGYQYVNGGPYDPMEVLSDRFPEAPEKILERAASRIYDEGHEWVKIGQY